MIKESGADGQRSQGASRETSSPEAAAVAVETMSGVEDPYSQTLNNERANLDRRIEAADMDYLITVLDQVNNWDTQSELSDQELAISDLVHRFKYDQKIAQRFSTYVKAFFREKPELVATELVPLLKRMSRVTSFGFDRRFYQDLGDFFGGQ